MYTATAQLEQIYLISDNSKAADDLELAVELLETFGKKFPSAKKIQNMVQAVSANLKMYNMTAVL
jgi:hypothetical protein